LFIGQDGPLIRYVYAPLSDISNIRESGNFPGSASGLTSPEDMLKLMRKVKPAEDVKRDTGTVNINEVTVSGTANAATSGILPGDVEQVLTIIAISLGTITLLAYLGFIVHMVLYRENGMHDSLPHVLGFIVCFIGLVVFSVYSEKEDD